MKFGTKKSHEMISSIPVGICPIKLIELYNKSHEGFMLSKYQEIASIGLKP
jgi:hypothetical protein